MAWIHKWPLFRSWFGRFHKYIFVKKWFCPLSEFGHRWSLASAWLYICLEKLNPTYRDYEKDNIYESNARDYGGKWRKQTRWHRMICGLYKTFCDFLMIRNTIRKGEHETRLQNWMTTKTVYKDNIE